MKKTPPMLYFCKYNTFYPHLKHTYMSVDLIAHLPQGKLLITDAMVSSVPNITSYRDCYLKDKIVKGITHHLYYSVVGDETVLLGIQYLDVWYSQTGQQLDIFHQADLVKALAVAEKITAVHKEKKTYNDKVFRDQTYLYQISSRSAVSYFVTNQNDQYAIQGRSEINLNDALINYGGVVQKINIDLFKNLPNEQCINVAIDYIKGHHSNTKILGTHRLSYDFDNRFSGVLIPTDGSDILTLPYRSIDEFIITLAGGGWDLLDNPPFTR